MKIWYTRDQKGQAVVEYMVMLVVAISLMGVLGGGMLRIQRYLMQIMACEISAPCPQCPPDPEVRNKIAQACR